MHCGQLGSNLSRERLRNPVTILHGSSVTVSPTWMTSSNVLAADLRPTGVMPTASINRRTPASRATLRSFVAVYFISHPPHSPALSQPAESFRPTLLPPARCLP